MAKDNVPSPDEKLGTGDNTSTGEKGVNEKNFVTVDSLFQKNYLHLTVDKGRCIVHHFC